MEMMKPTKGFAEDDEDDEDEYAKEDGSSHKGDMVTKADGKGNDQRANTPRSKHSATEQRRRSKINDRFQILRDLIPQHGEQKRDKASFLLEVIEYVQLLQEKVQKYEASYQGWNHDSLKLMPWKNSLGRGESMSDFSRAIKNGPGPGLMFAGKFDENNVAMAPSMLTNAQNLVESDNTNTGPSFKGIDHHSGLANKAVSMPSPLPQNMYSSGGGLAQFQQRLLSDAENLASRPQSQSWQRQGQADCPINSDMLNEHEELTIEGGTISLSSVYSQGLLNTLTQALHSSGVDLSQASISVQIDLGKRAISRPSATTSSAKDLEDPSSCNRAMTHSRVASSGEDSDHAQKRLRTGSQTT